MNTVTVNGSIFRVESDHTNFALMSMDSDNVLIEATFDHACEQIFINVHTEFKVVEEVNYFEFVNSTDDLIEWMANRLFQ